MMVEERIAGLGLTIPAPPTAKGAYLPLTRSGRILFISGTGSNVNGIRLYTGKVGAEISLEQARESARLAVLNSLAIIKQTVGDLDQVRILKLNGFVNSAPGFHQQPAVVDGASEFLEAVMGKNGCHARTAVGVYELPFNLSVEIEIIAEWMNG